MAREWSASTRRATSTLLVFAERLAGDLLPQFDERPERVDQEHRVDVLLQGRHPLQAHAGVDVLRRQGSVSCRASSML